MVRFTGFYGLNRFAGFHGSDWRVGVWVVGIDQFAGFHGSDRRVVCG